MTGHSKKVRKAIFPVGGLGTRFLPATKAIAKEMLPIVDKPLIQYAVEEALAAGIEQCIFVTSRGKGAIEDHFDYAHELQDTLKAKDKTALLEEVLAPVQAPGSIAYVRQQEPMGLGHAVWCARHFVQNEPVAILLADDLIKSGRSCIAQMVDVLEQEGGNVIAAMQVPDAHTSRYGIISPGAHKGAITEVTGLVEKPAPGTAPSNLAVIGRYILQPEIFAELDKQETGAGGEIQLTDAMAKLIGTQPFHGLAFEGERYDCGDKVGYIEATLAFGLDRDDLKEGVRAAIQSAHETLS
ncbi:MAG: UTP--glucose-1-phosphate uridylyltransferase GalU [Pseudomonadota bacterium]